MRQVARGVTAVESIGFVQSCSLARRVGGCTLDNAQHPVELEGLQEHEAGHEDGGGQDDLHLAEREAFPDRADDAEEQAREEDAAGEGEGGGEEDEEAGLEGAWGTPVVHDLRSVHEGAAEVEEGQDEEALTLDIKDVGEGEEREREEVVSDHVQS